MYYSNGFANAYDELLSFYPVYYRDVYEMQEILKAHGRIIDDLTDNINTSIDNAFILTCDINKVRKLEEFLDIPPNESMTLEERKRQLLTYFIGNGKISASIIKGVFRSYTNGQDCEIKLEKISDIDLDQVLKISCDILGSNSYTMLTNFLNKRLPAHIAYDITYEHNFSSGNSIAIIPICTEIIKLEGLNG